MCKSTEIYKTVLLDDDPADLDAFGAIHEDGPHYKVAKAIADLITSTTKDDAGEEQLIGGKAIALFGSWGSGKSTVIRFLKNILNSEQSIKNRLFTFDAWAHSGDVLRKSFLQKLLEYLRKDSWKEIDKFSQKVETLTNPKTTTRPSRLTKLLGIIVLLIPFGCVLVSTYSSTDYPHYALIGLIPLGTLLLLTITYIIISSIYHNDVNFQSKAGWIKKYCDLSFFSQDETTSDFRPTSFEFQEAFQNGLTKLFQSNPDRKLVIVIDNLDRIPKEEALSSWVTLRTFFEFENNEDIRKAFKHLWVIVPFDKDAIERLWPDGKNVAMIKDGNGSMENSTEGLANIFINKSFQAFFHVPPIIFKDWQSYFIKKMHAAFPNYKDEQTFRKVCDLFNSRDAYLDNDKDKNDSYLSPTPREIKTYINKIGNHVRRWKTKEGMELSDEMSFPIFAYYIIKEDEFRKNPSKIITDDLPIMHFFNNDAAYKKKLAAIYFGIKPKDAFLILLESEILKHLTSDKKEELVKEELLKLSYEDGFEITCQHVVIKHYNSWLGTKPICIPIIAHRLSVIAEERDKKFGYSWDALADGIVIHPTWQNMSFEIGSGLAAILGHIKDIDKLIKLGETITSEISDRAFAVFKPKCKPDDAYSILKGVYTVLEQINNLVIKRPNATDSEEPTRVIHDWKKTFKLKTKDLINYYQLRRFIPESLYSYLNKVEKQYINDYFVPQNFKIFFNEFIQLLKKDDYADNFEGIFMQFKQHNYYILSWLDFTEKIEKEIEGWKLEVGEYCNLLSVLIVLAFEFEDGDSKDTLWRRVSFGNNHYYISKAITNGNTRLNAILYFVNFISGTTLDPNLKNNPDSIIAGEKAYNEFIGDPESPSRKEIFDNFINLILRFDSDLNVTYQLSKRENYKVLTSSLFNNLYKTHRYLNHISLDLLKSDPEYFVKILTKEIYDYMVNQLNMKKIADDMGGG